MSVNHKAHESSCEACNNRKKEIRALKSDLEVSKSKISLLEKTSEQLSILLKNTPDFIYIKDADLRLTSASDSFARVTSHNSWEELVGKNHYDLFPLDHAELYIENDRGVIERGEALVSCEEPYYAKEGDLRWVISTKVPVRDKSGNIVGLVGISKDITELKKAQLQIRKMAEVDYLSGLLNRRAIHEKALPLYGRCIDAGDFAFILFIDLDNFKSVNDNYGHDRGDQVLVEFAKLLRAVVRSNELVARVGGDEFIIYLDRESNPNAGELLAKRILSEFKQAEFKEFTELGCSIGVSGNNKRGIALSELISMADKGMYMAKGALEPSYFIF